MKNLSDIRKEILSEGVKITPGVARLRYNKIFGDIDKFIKNIEKQISDISEGTYPDKLWHDGSLYRVPELFYLLEGTLKTLGEKKEEIQRQLPEHLKLWEK